jgi:hypothetical protein
MGASGDPVAANLVASFAHPDVDAVFKGINSKSVDGILVSYGPDERLRRRLAVAHAGRGRLGATARATLARADTPGTPEGEGRSVGNDSRYPDRIGPDAGAGLAGWKVVRHRADALLGGAHADQRIRVVRR